MKPLIKLSDDELARALEQTATNVVPSYNDLVAEVDRRIARRQTQASLMLSVVSLAIAAGAFLLAMLRP